MSARETPTLVLISGLAADENVFFPQKAVFPQLIVPDWPVPRPNETLDGYSGRIADALQSLDNVILGGASFGGIIALHVAHRVKPKAVLLIGSVRAPGELPPLVRYCRVLKPLIPLIPVRLLQLCCAGMTSKYFRRFAPHFSGLARQFRSSDPKVFRWSLARLLDWSVSTECDCPVYQIHGDCDRVLPIRYTSPDTVVEGGGHVITLTHSTDVNEFMRSAIAQHTEA